VSTTVRREVGSFAGGIAGSIDFEIALESSEDKADES
jgi:hypothetical protein